MQPIDVYLEIGSKKVIVGGLDWPGWCRISKDEDSALQALIDYGPRYAQALALEGIAFQPPAAVSALRVVERLRGSATTDFGAPDIPTSVDSRPFDEAECRRSQEIMRACWHALGRAVENAQGKELRKGPRGGGRELAGIVGHILESQMGYLNRISWKMTRDKTAGLQEQLDSMLQVVLDALENAARGELPETGPRGGKMWLPRYFVRRTAWHVLDHAWELEDRSQ